MIHFKTSFFKIGALFSIALIFSIQSKAQMEAARKIQYDADTLAKFNVPVSVLWDAIKEPAKWADISNGYIKSITVSEDLVGKNRMVHFADGTERKDMIAQYQPEYKFIVLKVYEPLPSEIKDNTMAFTAATDGKGFASLHVFIKVDGAEAEKIKMLDMLKKEAYAYIEGLRKLFQQKQ
jgi:hypothetical protein